MKFGKEFESQMVQEWQKAYMDYNGLKTVLKDILRFKQRNASTPVASTPRRSLKRRMSLYRAFSGLTNRYRNSPRNNDEEVILVDAVQQDGSELGQYQTTFLKPGEIGGEYELLFFRRLDDEFNKVISFYKLKVEEMMEEANELSKQMDALIALRMKVHNPMMKFDKAALEKLTSNSSTRTKSGSLHMNVIQEVEMSGERYMDDEIKETVETSGVQKRGNGRKVVSIQGFRPASLEVLDHVKLNITPETPVSTLKNILNSNVALSFTKKELRKVEERMIKAFTEFYRKLQLLKRYCFVNLMAFSKIMKKYDKIASRKASKTYMEMVENSYLGSSDEVSKLMERVEVNFTERFANGNHRKGLRILRPKTKREKHRITFSAGFFSGCSLALVATIVVLVRARDILRSPGRGRYMENIFPLYTLFGFIVLHMLMYSANIFFWKHYRVNYSFIFGFKQGTELDYREVFLLSSGLAVLALACVISNLDMDMDPGASIFGALTELVPLGLLTVVILITICPLNIIYRSSRFFLLRCAFRCVCAPLYKVTLPDFFLADQLTSQVPAFRNLQFYVCYYGWGYFRKPSNNRCLESEVSQAFYFAVAIIPYWSRLIQCLRRLVEEKDVKYAFNGLKYFSIVVALVTRTGNELKMGMTTWKIMAAVSSGVATIYATYWDIVIDWGLLRRNSINPWLRDKLLVPNRNVYYVAMVLNVLLRLAWMQSVLGLRETPVLHRYFMLYSIHFN
ncbi:phosphate transporter PHO1 homolog 9-like isoform X2 [Carya illinoinensis]|uniref:phosphate transporter PHO1 homolog 9-like isoform X2 n=1 Tax=Carya illinoinensis TaxID=32201 RepID=UPI001C71AD48|nr:phosphate transporter PHO1 homolog 9-like isoform X2 [Carya illinoinensis]